MAKEFRLSIVSPDRTVVDEVTTSVIAPGAFGYLGVLAGHEPLITELGTGRVSFRRPNGSEEVVAISGGFMEVSGESVIILADTAEMASEIDLDRARAALDRARQMLTSIQPGANVEELNEARERAENRLKVAQR